jgi:hypothetical protein
VRGAKKNKIALKIMIVASRMENFFPILQRELSFFTFFLEKRGHFSPGVPGHISIWALGPKSTETKFRTLANS